MERKKIILLATSDINYDQRLQKISATLSDKGAEVSLWGRKLKKSVALSPRNYSQTRLKCWFNNGVLFYAEINFRFFWKLVFSNANVVCANDVDTLLGAVLASYIKPFDLLYDSHEYFTEVPELANSKLKKSFGMSWKNGA